MLRSARTHCEPVATSIDRSSFNDDQNSRRPGIVLGRLLILIDSAADAPPGGRRAQGWVPAKSKSRRNANIFRKYAPESILRPRAFVAGGD